MSGNFDWQTEDEIRNQQQSNWDDLPEPANTPQPRRKMPWRLLAVVGVLIAGLGLIVWWRVQAQIDATTQALRNDVASSFNLVQLAIAEQDEELFRSVLSGRNPVWTTAQLELFKADQLLDRAPLGLTAIPESLPQNLPVPFDDAVADETAATIEFSPDLNEAVVTTVQPFVVNGLQDESDIVFLQQTAVFRRGVQRWLFAPAEGEFWGERQNIETDRLRIEYPERDEAIAARLADDLTDAIDRLCTEALDGCAGENRLVLNLEDDSSSLAVMAGTLGRQAALREAQRGSSLDLPTPTLIGLPVDDETEASAGYQALLNAYLPLVLETVVAQNVGWECCQQGALFEALSQHLLADLGYAAWPVDPSDYQQIMDEGIRLSDVAYFWRRTPAANREKDMAKIFVMVDFLLDTFPDLTPAHMLEQLPVSPNLEEWLNQLLATSDTVADNAWIMSSLDQAWWLFTLHGILPEEEPSPPPPADSLLYLACTPADDGQSDPSSVYRYDASSATWEDMLQVEGFIWMSPLPDPQTLLMQEFRLGEESWRAGIWRNQERQPLYQTDTGFSISFGEGDASGRFLISYAWEPENDQTQAILMDLDSCSAEGCEYGDIQGLPTWSPNGQLAIYSGDRTTLPYNVTITTNERIILLDSSGPLQSLPLTIGPSPSLAGPVETTAIDSGYSPFWLDDQTYGYIRSVRNGIADSAMDTEVVIASTEDNAQSILTSTDLQQFLPDAPESRRMTLAYIAPHPIDRELIFIVAMDELQRVAYIFSYDLALQTPEYRFRVRYDLNHSFGFSPDGRYLVVTGRDRTNGISGSANDSGVLYLHNIADNITIPFAIRLPFFLASVTYDWTADSQWLALAMDDNLIALVAPDERYVQTIVHPYGACTSVAWLEE